MVLFYMQHVGKPRVFEMKTAVTNYDRIRINSWFLILKQILLNLRKEKYVEQWKVPRAAGDVQEVLSWFDLELASVSLGSH